MSSNESNMRQIHTERPKGPKKGLASAGGIRKYTCTRISSVLSPGARTTTKWNWRQNETEESRKKWGLLRQKPQGRLDQWSWGLAVLERPTDKLWDIWPRSTEKVTKKQHRETIKNSFKMTREYSVTLSRTSWTSHELLLPQVHLETQRTGFSFCFCFLFW